MWQNDITLKLFNINKVCNRIASFTNNSKIVDDRGHLIPSPFRNQSTHRKSESVASGLTTI